jgi:hypothetical protein
MARSKSPQIKVSAEKHGAFLPDADSIRSMVFTPRGLRKAWPRKWSPPSRDSTLRRAYYVWRWARFHGGDDTRLPMLASTLCAEDSDLNSLDTLANRIALEVFGKDMIGSDRWREVLIGKKLAKAPIPFSSKALPGNNNGSKSTNKQFVS